MGVQTDVRRCREKFGSLPFRETVACFFYQPFFFIIKISLEVELHIIIELEKQFAKQQPHNL
jgi:hypothetical protein